MNNLKNFAFHFIIVLIVNYITHKYYNRKKNALLESLSNMDYIILENVKLKTVLSSSLNYSVLLSKADIIFFDKNIVIIPFLKIIKMAQPITQYSFDNNTHKLNGVSRLVNIKSFDMTSNSVKLTSKKVNYVPKSKLSVNVEFDSQPLDFEEIKRKYQYELHHRKIYTNRM